MLGNIHAISKGATRMPSRMRWLVVLASALLLPDMVLADPSWWADLSVTSTNAATDYAAVNAGQVKWIASNAWTELEANLPGGAGTGITALVNSFSLTNNYSAVSAGQIKNLAVPFWDRLMDEGYASEYPWSAVTTDDVSYAAANIGQLKRVFSFDLQLDSDSDGLANWVETGTGTYAGQYNTGSSHTNSDSDADGIADGVEVTNRTDPNNSDTTAPTVVITYPS